jgi:hypothetical protein
MRGSNISHPRHGAGTRAPSFELAALPEAAGASLLADAAARDQVTARRTLLFQILWRERFLTRGGLIARVEAALGRGAFGGSAWEDTFYRDMRAVKEAFRAAGYTLAYSRRAARPGYYLRGRPALHPDLAHALHGAIREVDPAQLALLRRLGPAGRFRRGSNVSDVARRAVAHRLRERRPARDAREAFRLAGGIPRE